jgi:hypothetical protein
MNLKPDTLEVGLRPVLERLTRPITVEHVVQWKRGMVRVLTSSEADPLQDGFKHGPHGAAAVSFAAAALLLFIDLNMPSLENTTSYRLAEQIKTLASIIRQLEEDLRGSAAKLQQLLANRSAGKPGHMKGDYYFALRAYRLGADRQEIARWFGINPYNDEVGKGTKSWKKKLWEAMNEGAIVERDRFPLAASIFAVKANPYVQNKAREAYQVYSQYPLPADYGQAQRADKDEFKTLLYALIGKTIRVNSQRSRGLQVIEAYCQLGSCLDRDIPPFPQQDWR